MDKIDIYNVGQADLDKRIKTFSKKNPEESKHVIEFLRLLGLGEINKGKGVSIRRKIRVLFNLGIIIPQIKKPVNQWTKEDIRGFIERLETNKIHKQNGKPYSDSLKQDLKIQIKSYVKWRQPKRYLSLTDWIDIRLKKKSPVTLTEEEILRLVDNCKTIEGRYIISILFDSGCRIEEFLNLRFGDLIAPTEEFPYYKIIVRTEYSKTYGRTIGLYWKNSTKAIEEYLSTIPKEGRQADKQILPVTYDSVRMLLSRLGKKILGKRIHAHMFRKSSASYYGSKMTELQLKKRFGWTMDSKMLGVYCNRDSIQENEIKEVMLDNDLNKMKKEIELLKEKERLTKISIESLVNDLTYMFAHPIENGRLDQDKAERNKKILELIKKNPNVEWSELSKKIVRMS